MQHRQLPLDELQNGMCKSYAVLDPAAYGRMTLLGTDIPYATPGFNRISVGIASYLCPVTLCPPLQP